MLKMNPIYLKLIQTVFMISLVLQVCSKDAVRCIESERQALLEFKAGLVDHYGMLTSWTMADCCQWKGIDCSNLTGHVYMLDLHGDYDEDSKFYISGKIHKSLVELRQLKYLNLSHNDFQGNHIPDFFGSLSNLRYLDLSICYFKGNIPPQLGFLLHLKYLNLSGNKLDGLIPHQLGNLSILEFLDLRFNSLEGEVPSQLGKLRSLQNLYLGGYDGALKIDNGNHNQGQWLSNLTSLTNLHLLSISNLDRSNSWLQMIGKIPKLRELSLVHCSLSDHFILSLSPSKYNFSTSLSVLDLSRNNFASSVIFKWVSNISPNLVEIDLSGNLMGDDLSNHFTIEMINRLPKLTKLRLSNCDLTDSFLLSQATFNKLNVTTSLFILDLSFNNFKSFMIFQWVSNISPNLVELDLSSNFLEAPSSCDYGITMNFLERLDLSHNRLNGRGILKLLMNVCTLRSLHLNENNFIEDLPSILHNLSDGCVRNSLQRLYLSSNKIIGTLPDLSIFASLKALDLFENQLSGKIPESSSLPSELEYLSIMYNSLEGGIPKSFGNACKLNSLQLSNNGFSAELQVIIRRLSGCARNSLQFLDLSMNQINGTLPDLSIFSSLKSLDISENMLNGKVAEDIRFPTQLEMLYMQSNSLHGVISDSHFFNMSMLKDLYLYDNSLTLTFTQNWIPPFQLLFIRLRSCKLGNEFPKWLQSQIYFQDLDISNSNISDSVPEWFWANLALQDRRSINISYNHLKGSIPNLPIRNRCSFFTLASNEFEGSIPPFLLGSTILDMSQNKFSHSFSFFCENGIDETLYQLDLSYNQLSGRIPDCWDHFKLLSYVDLSHNNFSGKIPTSIGSLVKLQALLLRNNSLIEDIPSSIMNCTNLVMLDVRENSLSGLIPSWIGSKLKELQVLSIQGNHFFGSLPSELCYLQNIQIFDLSLNNLSGRIPRCIENFTSMVDKTSSNGFFRHSYFINKFGTRYTYKLNAFLTWKGVEQEFKNNELFLLKSIDLSRNHFSQEIPAEMANLIGLVSLNLSRNNLIGKIPSNIGNLTSLDFLDLSRNKLIGSIPYSLARIDRLGVLDLSHNHLYGEIPTSTQLQSFSASSYEYNLDLCGLPLEKLCIEGEPTHEPKVKIQDQDDEDLLLNHGFYISMAFGFVIGFWGVFGTILIKRSWRHAYFKFMNNLVDTIYVMCIRKLKD